MDLLGCTLTRNSPEGRTSGVIVETEAYRPEDPACHAYNGKTMRNRNIFGAPGLAYIYLSYGIHRLVNAVCEGEGVGSAVLIRALKPTEGQEMMIQRRGRNTGLCNGPGKLTQALGVTLEEDGNYLTNGGLSIVWGPSPEAEIVSTTRIGITRGAELPWRYLLLGDPNVSVRPEQLHHRGLRRSD
ncbi:DNA-3-methyladenine glycosylase [soil metagenome]